jgi:hypothetical protein
VAQWWRIARVCLLYAVSLRVGCVECYTATEGAVCVSARNLAFCVLLKMLLQKGQTGIVMLE